MDRLEVSVTDFRRNIGRYQDLALRQPIVVIHNGHESTVLISMAEYERLKRRDREVLGLDDFTEAELSALEASRPPAEAMAFNDESR